MHCPIEYMADVLTVGDLEERVALVDELMKEGKITGVRRSVRLAALEFQLLIVRIDRNYVYVSGAIGHAS